MRSICNPTPSDAPAMTVVIPTRDYGYYIRDALDSALPQLLAGDELIVVDDGSTDDTRAILGEYGDTVHVLSTGGIGVYAARQRALDHIATDWFFNLDADNLLAPDFIVRMREAAARVATQPDVAFLYPDIRRIGCGQDSFKPAEAFDSRTLKRRNYLDMNALFRTATARRVGFDPQFNDGQGDYDFFLSVARLGQRGEPVPGAVLIYRMHEASITRRSRRRFRQRILLRRLMAKHRDFFTREERRAAKRECRNRALVALIDARSPAAPLLTRLDDWLRFTRIGLRHAEWRAQTRYTLSPGHYFARTRASAEVFYLFRDAKWTREALDDADARCPIRARELLFGYPGWAERGITVDHQLRYAAFNAGSNISPDSIADVAARLRSSYLWQANRARVVIATDTLLGLAALQLRKTSSLRPPLVICWSSHSSGWNADPNLLRCAALLVVRDGDGDATEFPMKRLEGKLLSIPVAVDGAYWGGSTWPARSACALDVLIIGTSRFLDEGLAVELARRLPRRRFALHVMDGRAEYAKSTETNLLVMGPMTPDQTRRRMANARAVLIPARNEARVLARPYFLRALATGAPVVTNINDARCSSTRVETLSDRLEQAICDGRRSDVYPAVYADALSIERWEQTFIDSVERVMRNQVIS